MVEWILEINKCSGFYIQVELHMFVNEFNFGAMYIPPKRVGWQAGSLHHNLFANGSKPGAILVTANSVIECSATC